MEKRQKYFEEALSDFVFDVAGGGAIRHLVDLGYSLDQMMQALSYPAPRQRVQNSAYRYMRESGLLLRSLSERTGNDEGQEAAGFRVVRLRISDRDGLHRYLYEKTEENGEAQTYISCPFGLAKEGGRLPDADEIRKGLACLNRREQDYIAGIPWENRVMYHRLNSRMREIGRKLIMRPEIGCQYYFLRTGEVVEGV